MRATLTVCTVDVDVQLVAQGSEGRIDGSQVGADMTGSSTGMEICGP